MNTQKPYTKSNLYAKILVLFLLFFIGLIISTEIKDTFNKKWVNTFYISIGAFWGFFIVYGSRLLKVFSFPKIYIRMIYALMAIALILALTIVNPIFDFHSDRTFAPVFFFYHVFTLCMTIMISIGILKDIFSSESTKVDHIWGAIVVYFFGVLAFGEIYEMITIVEPGLLGKVYTMGIQNFAECILFSANAVSGLDSLYPDADPLLKKLANIENIAGNLFLIVILGRLLSHPLKSR